MLAGREECSRPLGKFLCLWRCRCSEVDLEANLFCSQHPAMARVAKTASEDLFALHLRGDCRRFTAIQQVVQSVYSLSKLFSGIALHGSKLTCGAQKIDSGCVQWDGEGFPELGCVLIPSHRPPPSITVVCGLPSLDHINRLFSGYLSLMI